MCIRTNRNTMSFGFACLFRHIAFSRWLAALVAALIWSSELLSKEISIKNYEIF